MQLFLDYLYSIKIPHRFNTKTVFPYSIQLIKFNFTIVNLITKTQSFICKGKQNFSMITNAIKTTTISAVLLGLMLIPFSISHAQMNPMTASGTLESVQDPGIGHEGHQLAIILPPSDNIYSGTLKYNATEPIQLVALHGPIDEEDDMGQPIWTTDGETKFALTFVDHQMSEGTWDFVGNALAVHTKNTEPFMVDYSVDYLESSPSEMVMSGTMQSIQDPGMGHEGHQLIIILPPGEDVNSGILAYSASEPIQLVSLEGPLKKGPIKDQAIWTPDGETNYALTFVDPENAMGTWMFSGNALAVHTKNPEQFTASFSVHAKPMTPGMQGQMGMQGQDGMMQGKGGMMKGQDGMMKNGTMQDNMGMMKRAMPPVQQMKMGIAPQDITCNEGLDLIFKSHNGKPICVKPFTASVLMERGWAMSSP